jgi:hypothetical protein
VIVSDLNLVGVVVPPFKAHSPLVVYPDRVLPGTFALQLLKSIPWRGAKVLDRLRVVEYPELPQSRLLHFVGEMLVNLALIDALGLLVGERFDDN